MWAMIFEGIGGVRRTLGRHFVALIISWRASPFFPMTKPGFLASIITSPTVGSNVTLVISDSEGAIFLIIFSVSASERRTVGSERTTIRFLIKFTMSVTMKLCSTRISGFFVYIASLGPSNSIRVISASFGTCESIHSRIFACASSNTEVNEALPT